MNKNIFNVFLAIIILFALISVNLIYIQLINPQKILGRPENLRYILDEASKPRGDIYSKDGALLAYSDHDGQFYSRRYPFGETFEPVLGFFNTKHGKSGIELALDDYIGYKKEPGLIDTISRLISMNISGEPDTVTLTINSKMQKRAFDLLSNRRGAVVAINPKSGEIITMVSSPSFDPNGLTKDWEILSKDDSAPFLYRAIAGLYPPGSTFKIIVAAAALESSIGVDKTMKCSGKILIDGNIIRDFEDKQHGDVNLSKALEKSCNIFFASLSQDLGIDLILKYSQKFGFEKNIPFELPVQISQLGISRDADNVELAWTSVGQANVLVTPLEMALISSAIANDGVIMEPYLLDKVTTANGRIIKQSSPKVLFNSIENQTAISISKMMQDVIKSGTGRAANLPGINIAGKTGTAEVEAGMEPHSWFIGFAPAEDPQIAVSVIIENGGPGGREAAFVFRELISQYLKEL